MSDKERHELLRKLLIKLSCDWERLAKKESSLGNAEAEYRYKACANAVFNALQKADEIKDFQP